MNLRERSLLAIPIPDRIVFSGERDYVPAPRRILIPGLRDLDASSRIETLLAALQDAWNEPQPILLDFTPCRALTPAGGGVVAMLRLYRERVGQTTNIDWETLTPNVRHQLARWQILQLFPGGHFVIGERSVPLLHQTRPQPARLVHYLERWVMPNFSMNEELQKETRRAFCEIFNNIFEHSESRIGGVAIGRLYPLAKPWPRFHLCIGDRGVGLVNRVQRAGYGLESPAAAIRWALEQGNSTKVGSDPPGLGLYLLQEFVTANEGSFFVCANGTWYSQVAGAITGGQLGHAFPGTLIELRLYVREDVSYILSDE